MKIEKNGNRTIVTDLAVIGAGGAGFAAAVSAAEDGIKNITILEKTAKPGGNSLNIGCFFAVNSPLQKRMGIHVSEEMAFHDKMAHCHWKVNARLIRDTINISGNIVQWLENKGVIFERMMTPGFGSDAPRVAHDASTKGEFGFTGRLIINALSDECQKSGIKILYNMRARKITFSDDKSFRISAERKKGNIEISAKAVVLSTGGFAGDRSLVEKYFPGLGQLSIGSVPQVTGDGLVMAEGLGAITDDRICLLLMGPFSSVNLGMVTPDIVYVNKEGERYYDESAQFNNYNPDDTANTVTRQRDKVSYAIFDTKIKESMAERAAETTGLMRTNKDSIDENIRKAVPEGKAIVSDSWTEIAGYIGAKPQVLKATVEQYNSFCDYRYDADFFKKPQYLIALRKPPYFAIKCQPGINTTFGGIKINHRTEVLNKQDIPIAGLYAVGDNAGSWAPATYSHRYPGSAASFALCSGYIAGKNAADFLTRTNKK